MSTQSTGVDPFSLDLSTIPPVDPANTVDPQALIAETEARLRQQYEADLQKKSAEDKARFEQALRALSGEPATSVPANQEWVNDVSDPAKAQKIFQEIARQAAQAELGVYSQEAFIMNTIAAQHPDLVNASRFIRGDAYQIIGEAQKAGKTVTLHDALNQAITKFRTDVGKPVSADPAKKTASQAIQSISYDPTGQQAQSTNNKVDYDQAAKMTPTDYAKNRATLAAASGVTL